MDERKKKDLKHSKSEEGEKPKKNKLSRTKSLRDAFFGKKEKEAAKEFDIETTIKNLKGSPDEKKKALEALLENKKMWEAFEKATKSYYVEENLDFFKDYHDALNKELFTALTTVYDKHIKTGKVNIYTADKTDLDDNRHASTPEKQQIFVNAFQELADITKKEFLIDMSKKTNFIANVEKELRNEQAEKKHSKKK